VVEVVEATDAGAEELIALVGEPAEDGFAFLDEACAGSAGADDEDVLKVRAELSAAFEDPARAVGREEEVFQCAEVGRGRSAGDIDRTGHGGFRRAGNLGVDDFDGTGGRDGRQGGRDARRREHGCVPDKSTRVRHTQPP
jgi:hypothetical protein